MEDGAAAPEPLRTTVAIHMPMFSRATQAQGAKRPDGAVESGSCIPPQRDCGVIAHVTAADQGGRWTLD